MWRSFFLAIGVYLVLLGGQCLGVQKFVLKGSQSAPAQQSSLFTAPTRSTPGKELQPPPWAPWSLMSTGLVVCLYSFSIPKRMHGP
jgi:hypothetical protein